MSHDLYASWATAALAQELKIRPSECFSVLPSSNNFDIFANRESGRNWPIPDGRLSVDTQGQRFEIALEMKRTNEGLHGILTAIGQSQAYIHPEKGYTASVIVVPDSYITHASPGKYIKEVLDNIKPNMPIGIYSYSPPDSAMASPFKGKLTCHKPIEMLLDKPVEGELATSKSSNQWAHFREGSSEPDAFYRYLQTAKKLNHNESEERVFILKNELVEAARRVKPHIDPYKYLSYSSNDTLHDKTWRIFWFDYILTEEVSILFEKTGSIYSPKDVATKLMQFSSTEPKKFFSGRSDSIKVKLCEKMSLSSNPITECQAWEQFAENIRKRAHSFREDIDSGLEHLGLLESDGKPSELGYKFVDACERTDSTFSGNPKLILGATILKNGNLIAFLHYFHRLSEDKFRDDNLAYTTIKVNDKPKFDQKEYLEWIKSQMVQELKVMSISTSRGGNARNAFQAELAILRKFNFVQGFRVGVGLVINWPLIQEYLEYDLT